jgi:hypothetical protein
VNAISKSSPWPEIRPPRGRIDFAPGVVVGACRLRPLLAERVGFHADSISARSVTSIFSLALMPVLEIEGSFWVDWPERPWEMANRYGMYSFRAERTVGRWASCRGPRGRRLWALRARRRAWRAVDADCGSEGCVDEDMNVWNERGEVVGRVNA